MQKHLEINSFTIRAYLVITNSENQLLISEEKWRGMRMRKFPGGGVEFGEGISDCLQREAMEELAQDVEVLEHIYTSDFFQQALFNSKKQLVAVYYHAKLLTPNELKTTNKPFDFIVEEDGAMTFRWVNINEISAEDMSFPVDIAAMRIVKQQYANCAGIFADDTGKTE